MTLFEQGSSIRNQEIFELGINFQGRVLEKARTLAVAHQIHSRLEHNSVCVIRATGIAIY